MVLLFFFCFSDQTTWMFFVQVCCTVPFQFHFSTTDGKRTLHGLLNCYFPLLSFRKEHDCILTVTYMSPLLEKNLLLNEIFKMLFYIINLTCKTICFDTECLLTKVGHKPQQVLGFFWHQMAVQTAAVWPLTLCWSYCYYLQPGNRGIYSIIRGHWLTGSQTTTMSRSKNILYLILICPKGSRFSTLKEKFSSFSKKLPAISSIF